MSTLSERVLDWTQTYCDSLTENYKQHSIRMYQSSDSDYSKKQLESVNNGTANLTNFVIKNGRKYYKIMQREFRNDDWREGCVHSFVDKNTGEVYKPASYNSPAKYVRYDMRIINQREQLHDPNYTGWAGGYLYLRQEIIMSVITNQLDFLSEVLQDFCLQYNLELHSADDILYGSSGDELTEYQKEWLRNYIEVWDTIANL